MAELEIARIELDQTRHCAYLNRIEQRLRCDFVVEFAKLFANSPLQASLK